MGILWKIRIRRWKKKRAVEPLIKALGDRDSDVRKEAAKALGEIGDPRAIESLIGALGDRDNSVRGAAAKALGEIGDPRAVEPLIKALEDERWWVPEEAAKALGEIGDPKAVEPLIKALGDKVWWVREEAASALTEIMDPNSRLRPFHPHLLCSQCYLRTEMKKVRAGLFKRYTFIVCRGCGGTGYLIKDVKQVVGVIDGRFSGYQVDGERVYLSLWSEAEKKARNADIDILEIRNSHEVESYDWAINAVVVALINDPSRPRDYFKRVPVILKDNPPVSEGSMRLLRKEFGDVRDE